MTTSPSSSIPSPQFFQRKPVQVQAMQWPLTADDSPRYHDTVGALFNWVSESGGIIVNRILPEAQVVNGVPETIPTLVVEDDEIMVWPGDWIVRMPGYADPETGKPSEENRFIVETAIDFVEDYQNQARAMRGGLDVMAQIKKVAVAAEAEEGSMTPAQRRDAASVDLHRLGDVAKGGR